MRLVALNSNKFLSENVTVTIDIYGLIDGDWVYINNSKFRSVCEDGGFNATALLSWLKNNKLIQTRAGITPEANASTEYLGEYVVFKLPNYDDENDIKLSDYDIEVL